MTVLDANAPWWSSDGEIGSESEDDPVFILSCRPIVGKFAGHHALSFALIIVDSLQHAQSCLSSQAKLFIGHWKFNTFCSSSLLIMPAEVQRRPTPPETDFHHHGAHSNWNGQHREALRLALGSILAPKRPTQSRSSSGTASPALPSNQTLHPSSPGARPVDSHFHFLHPHHNVPHTPSRLSQSESTARDFPSTNPLPYTQGIPSPIPLTRANSDSDTAGTQSNAPEVPPAHGPDPDASQAAKANTDGSGSGSGTPKAKFLETLQSKSAWEALIHGSFS
ncbi:hypothetical protein C8J56DRAFT_937505 [Mycena floridula]|nr:hypothetical protein C8J56DRAFT_937505 [Mycena floridula]